jgi:molecular chaperone Hsp33
MTSDPGPRTAYDIRRHRPPGDDPLGEQDDIVAAFQLDRRAVRGRVVRLGEVANLILSAHDYPPSVAAILGEAILLAVLIGDALKFDGRLIIQASREHGTDHHPVSFLVADYTVGEGVRGFAQYDADGVRAVEAETGPRPGAERLLGAGSFAMTIDQGPDMDRYQGVVALDGPTLASCAEHYFEQSEQIPTRIKLAVGEDIGDGGARRWRAGGAMLQRLAGDETRVLAPDDYDTALALFDTTEDAELIDPDISAGRLLFRLFHEDGVRLYEPRTVARRCTCDR